MPNTRELDRTILEAALEGLERRLTEINAKIAEVKSILGGGRAKSEDAPTVTRKKRVMSAAARKRIAEAQKRRWEQFRAKKSGKRGQKQQAESEEE